MMRSAYFAWLLAAGGLTLASPCWSATPPGARLPLKTGWRLQSSAKVPETGAAVSTPGYRPEGWHRAPVPGTVLAALVENKVYPDPYFGSNLRSIPGAGYPIGQNFSNLPMPVDSPFRAAWWYRTEFEVPSALAGRTLWLHFDGINYRANVWMNGQLVAGADEVAGPFRRYEFDVTRFAKPLSALAVEVFAPEPQDLGITWVDWNPAPPDKDMGLWGDVYLTDSGPLALRHPQVVTRFDLPSLETAHLTVTAEVRNTTDQPVRGTVRGQIEAIHFSQPVALGPRESTSVRVTPEHVPSLSVAHPRVWWPYRLGSPNLYTLALEVEAGGAISDRQEVRFGMQQISSELTEGGHRLFKVNGRPLLVRGGGWAPDMMLRPSPSRWEAELRYVREMGLNTIRLEGKLDNDALFDLADRNGILVMAGWCCCDHWEQWDKWSPENRRVAAASLTDQIRRLRNHPSLLVWLNGSDNPPPPEIERTYLDILAALGWPKPILSSATKKPTPLSGPTGVKMSGPYDYVPPAYWLAAESPGGFSGFNMETSPGAAVPPLESLKEMLAADHLWPIDAEWNFHAGGGQFKDLARFTEALEARYGKAAGVEDYARKAQALAYEGERAMFEAFGRNKYGSTGVVQWMLNNAWPSLIWHLYDYSLRPGGGYYGTKKACEPLHVQYSYDDRSVVVVNDGTEGKAGLRATARVFDFRLAPKLSREAALDVPPDGVARAFVLPDVPALTPTYFLQLGLLDSGGRSLSSNFYWLSTREDGLAWEKSDWFHTPVKTHADLTALATLPPTTLALSARFEEAGAEGMARVRIENTGPSLAFQVHLKLTEGAGGREILPVFWEDNYLALLPGEKREIRVSYPLPPGGVRPVVEVDAWNASRATYGAAR
jgi:exo-1,4-beta-D-glucosaminidase